MPNHFFPAQLVRRLKSWDALAIALLVSWVWIFYFPVTLGQQTFGEADLFYLFVPIRAELARAFAQGRLPFWTTGLQAGFPLFAEGEVAALYPLHWLVYGLWSPAMGISYEILFHRAWMVVGMYLLCRASGLRVPSAFVGAWVFANSGFMNAQLPHVPHLAVASWLPWLLLAQQRYWRARFVARRATTWFILICAILGLEFVGGFPQIAIWNIATFWLCGILAPVLWRNKATWGRGDLLRTLMVTTAMSALGVGLGAMQLLPTTELIGQSIRAQTDPAFFTSYSLDPAYLAQFVAPFVVLGKPFAANLEFWGYVGVLPLGLVFLALVWRRDALTWFWVVFTVGALVLALGKFTPLYDWLYYVPVFNRFRVPARFLLMVTFGLAFLAALGCDALLNRLRAPQRINKKLGLVALGLAIIVIVIVNRTYTESIEFWMNGRVWLPVFWSVSSLGLLFLALGRILDRYTFAVVALGMIVLDLTLFAAPFATTLASTVPPTDWTATPRTVRAMASAPEIYRIYSDKIPAATRAALRAGLITNLALVYGKDTATGYMDSLGLKRNAEYARAMTPTMRDLLNIRYYLYPYEPLPWDDPPSQDGEPEIGLSLNLLRQQPNIPFTRARQLVLDSYTAETIDLPNDFVAGEIRITFENDMTTTLPIRLGKETADWAFDGLTAQAVQHAKPSAAQKISGYLASVGREFLGNVYRAQFDLPASAQRIKSLGVESFLPDGGLGIVSIVLVDEQGNRVALASLLGRNDLVLAFKSHTAAMWENRTVLPRAFIAHRAEIVGEADTLARLQDPAFQPRALVLLNDGQPLNPTALPATDDVTITKMESERVMIRAYTSVAGYLVLTDSWYPGWIARVDGKPATIQRADYIFRAVALEPGTHEIVFEYQPTWFYWGVGVSACCALIILALVWLKVM